MNFEAAAGGGWGGKLEPLLSFYGGEVSLIVGGREDGRAARVIRRHGGRHGAQGAARGQGELGRGFWQAEAGRHGVTGRGLAAVTLGVRVLIDVVTTGPALVLGVASLQDLLHSPVEVEHGGVR